MNFDKKEITNTLRKSGIYIGQLPESLTSDLWNQLYKNGIPGDFNTQYQQWFFRVMSNPTAVGICLNEGLLKGLHDYYGSQPYLRDVFAVTTPAAEKQSNGHAFGFHTDYLGATALMVLLTDIGMEDTHMEFCPTFKTASARHCILDNEVYGHHEIIHCVGKKGTFFLFDQGNFVHKGTIKNGRRRDMLHAVYMDAQNYNGKVKETIDTDFQFLTNYQLESLRFQMQ